MWPDWLNTHRLGERYSATKQQNVILADNDVLTGRTLALTGIGDFILMVTSTIRERLARIRVIDHLNAERFIVFFWKTEESRVSAPLGTGAPLLSQDTWPVVSCLCQSCITQL